jgi:hypothetical protein
MYRRRQSYGLLRATKLGFPILSLLLTYKCQQRSSRPEQQKSLAYARLYSSFSAVAYLAFGGATKA